MGQDDTKTRLLEAAGEEFAERGLEGATIRAIIERAKANIAAVNYHFGDKERLYVQAVMEAHRCSTDGLDDPQDVPTAPEDQLRFFIRNFLSHVLAVGNVDTWHQKLMLREMLRPTPALETLAREVIRPRFERLVGILRLARPDLDERRLTVTAFSVIGQCLHYKLARSVTERLIGTEAFASLDVDYLSDHIANFSLAALGLMAPVGEGNSQTSNAEPTPSGSGSKS